MRYHVSTLLIFNLALFIAPLHANIIHVPGDSATIQGGINGAVDGDTVMVAAGTYHEYDIDFRGKAITVMGTDPDDSAVVAATVVDGGGQGSVFTFQSGEDRSSLLTGLTIADGFAMHGGGIFCWGASPTIARNIIRDNRASNNGGGIICGISSFAIISDNTVKGNSAANGAGIYCYWFSSPRIMNNIVMDNEADTKGGGIRCYQNSSPTILNNIIALNWAGDSGGGIACDWSCEPRITNDVITGNSASWVGGGGMRCYNSSPTIVNTIFWGNDAPTGRELYIGGYDDPSVFTIRYSDVEGGQDSVYIEPGSVLNWGPGMIDDDPGFIALRGFDYLLSPSSTCIDAGDPSIEDGFDWPDWYPSGPRSDMGAYGGPGNVGWLH